MLEDDDYLRIQLISYDKPEELTDRYYFLEMSTLQATTLLAQELEIVSSKTEAYGGDGGYLSDSQIPTFKTVGDFNNYFLSRQKLYLHNCDLHLKDGTTINSHDDGEVSISIINAGEEIPGIIRKIFEKYNLDKKLIDLIKSKPGHCLAINENSEVTKDFKDFDEYVRKGR